jgi:hypothetical protein
MPATSTFEHYNPAKPTQKPETSKTQAFRVPLSPLPGTEYAQSATNSIANKGIYRIDPIVIKLSGSLNFLIWHSQSKSANIASMSAKTRIFSAVAGFWKKEGVPSCLEL